MHKSILSLAAAACLAAASLVPGAAQAAPGGLSRPLSNAAVDLNMVEDAQYIWGGRNYCFYLDGWRGPGWYWCGYSWRRGYGWGGGRGWHGWAWHGRGYHGRNYHRGGRVYRGGGRTGTHVRVRSNTHVRTGGGVHVRSGGGAHVRAAGGGGGHRGGGGGGGHGGGGHGGGGGHR